MRPVNRWPALLFLAVCLAAGWGCGKPGLKLVPVSGVVVNGGKPVANVTIAFAADISGGGPTLDAFGSTDGDGNFSLQTVMQGQGAPAGRYKVIITTDGPAARLIPAHIMSLSTTRLVVDIPPEGTHDLKLDLAKYK